jgi:Rho-binding antiterminator
LQDAELQQPASRIPHSVPGTDREQIEVMTEPYDPISCDAHDQLEAAAMHRKPVELEFALEGVPQKERGRIEDVYSSHGAEFVKFVSDRGPLDIRLDQIISVRDA